MVFPLEKCYECTSAKYRQLFVSLHWVIFWQRRLITFHDHMLTPKGGAYQNHSERLTRELVFITEASNIQIFWERGCIVEEIPYDCMSNHIIQ